MNENTKLHANELTQSQTLLWTGQMLHPQSPMYNMVMTFELLDSINVPAFQAAFQALVDGSDVMRTVILSDGGTPQQLTKDKLQYNLEFINLSNKIEAQTTFKTWLKTRSEQNFDLSKTLFDSSLVQFSEKRFVWYFNQHHLLTDGWSLTVLYKEMAKLYVLALQNELANASEILPFQSYLNFEKNIRNQPKKEKITQYWKEKSENLPSSPRLYGKVGKENSSQAKRVLVNLGKVRSDALRSLTKEKDLRAFTQDMSLFNIFSTVLFTYLNRVSGQENLLIGAPSHNRPTVDFKNTPGVFIEIFPMQTAVELEDTFMDLFRKVRTEASGFLRNAQSGYSSPALSGSFNVLLNYISGSFGDFSGIPMQSEWILPGNTDPAHHLRLQVHDFDLTGEIKLHFDMNTEVFDAQLCKNAPQHFLRLLDAFIENRNQNLSACEILSKEERQHILKGLNNTKKDFFPQQQTLLTLFEKQVLKTPNAPAIQFEEIIFSYTQFNQKANQLGRFLQSQYSDNEGIVAIVMERSVEMPLAIYGILKAGLAYLPIDPKHPSDRIEFMLKDANVKVVLTQAHLSINIKNKDIKVIPLNQNWTKIAEQNSENLKLNITPNSLAYIIYTSGSTGQPKGVAVEHVNICNRLNWIKDIVKIDEVDVYLQKTPYTFDVSVPEFFWPLQTGGKIVMARPEGHKNPNYLVETIQKYNITTLHFVPSMMSVFLEEKGLEDCNSLRRVFTSGEAISATLQNRFFEKFDIELHNLYGPTEAAVEVTHWQCQPEMTDPVVPIGAPVANTQIYILDQYLQPVPLGTPGELYIAGIQVARGYLNRPKLTEERFVNDIFSKITGAKMYRSGDLARHRENGVIEYLGRVDFQVKLRGFRIELGEIEAKLEEHIAVKQAVVVMRESDKRGQYLTAFYTGEKVPNDIPFIHYLAGQLPEYMIPSHFVHLDEFILASSGKVDRKSLPKTELSKVDTQTEYVAAGTQIEELLVEIWEEILQIEKIGIHDNFIEMGGHSLTAIRLVSRIVDNFDLTLPINLVFRKPTIAGYAAHIEEIIIGLLAEEEEG